MCLHFHVENEQRITDQNKWIILWKGLITGRKLTLWARLIGFLYCYCLFFNNKGVTFLWVPPKSWVRLRMCGTHTDDTKSRCALLSSMHILYLPVDAHLVFFFHPLCVCPFLCCWRDVNGPHCGKTGLLLHFSVHKYCKCQARVFVYQQDTNVVRWSLRNDVSLLFS